MIYKYVCISQPSIQKVLLIMQETCCMKMYSSNFIQGQNMKPSNKSILIQVTLI